MTSQDRKRNGMVRRDGTWFSSVVASICLLVVTNLAAGIIGSREQQFTQLVVNGGATTVFSIHNPGQDGVDVTIQLYDSAGNPLEDRVVAVAPGGTESRTFGGADGLLSVGWAKLSAASSFTVTEFFEITGLNRVGVLASNVSSESRFFGFVNERLDTGVAVNNASAEQGTDVTVRIFDGDGNEVQPEASFPLGALQQRAVFLTELFEGLTDFEGTVQVSSSPLPVGSVALTQEASTNLLATIATTSPEPPPFGTVDPVGNIRLADDASIFGVDALVGFNDLRFFTDNVAANEQMRLTANGFLGIGTTEPTEQLHVNGNIRLGGFQGSIFGLDFLQGSDDIRFAVGEERGIKEWMLLTNTGQLIIADQPFLGHNASRPNERLNIGSFAEEQDTYLALRTAGGNRFRGGIHFRSFDNQLGFTIENDERHVSNGLNILRYDSAAGNAPAGESTLFIDKLTGFVGINTVSPQGRLDVNGAIFHRGAELHADFVFQEGYPLDTIEDHADRMWREQHLPAVPARWVDEYGNEILEVGAHRRGMLEELEISHIYISQLNEKLKQQQHEIHELREALANIQKQIER